MTRSRLLRNVLLVLPFLCLSTVAKASIRIELLPQVSTRSNVVKLSMCMPSNSPSAIRDSAESIVLGDSPRAGSQRTFDRNDILLALADAPNLRKMLDIPASITVTRWSRTITREEALAAIEKALAANHFAISGNLSPSNLTFGTPVAVTEASPKLSVMRVDPDPAASKTRIALWTTSEPGTPPFWVTLDRVIETTPHDGTAHSSLARTNQRVLAEANSARLEKEQSLSPLDRNIPVRQPLAEQQPAAAHPTLRNGPVFVHAGKPIQLIVQGSGMRITASAIALETGHEGEQVRVQCSASGKILVAKVVALQTVQISY